MKGIIAAARVRTLRRASLILARAMRACSRSLLKASANLPNIDVVAEGEITTQQPCAAVERLLVLQVLEHDKPCSSEQLEAALDTTESLAIHEALRALDEKDITLTYHEQVYPSRCLLSLDELGLISI
jgi:hypothetical protein